MPKDNKDAKKAAILIIQAKMKGKMKDKMMKKKDIKHDNKDLAYDIEKKDEAFKKGDVAEARHYEKDEAYKSKGRDYDEKEDKKAKLKAMMKK